jgi:hypothetical protein
VQAVVDLRRERSVVEVKIGDVAEVQIGDVAGTASSSRQPRQRLGAWPLAHGGAGDR